MTAILNYRLHASTTEMVTSAYGQWLAHVMNAKRADTNKLAKKAGVSTNVIDDLLNGRLEPEKAKEEVSKIGQVLIGANPSPKEAMDKVLEALKIHTDLRNWSADCDGGCCPWHIATEIAYDKASKIR